MRETTKRARKMRAISLTLILGILISQMSVLTSAADPVYHKDTNTAFITHKSAQWVDVDNYLAELTLRVNGTQVLEPLDVIIVLDRSGSMDMNYVQPSGDNRYLTFASCPCLNQDHFYLEPTKITYSKEEMGHETTELIYDADAATLTVYNEQDELWVVLDTSEKIHHYYEFGHETLPYTPYHFKMQGDTFVRISKWDTSDSRITGQGCDGLWDHADEDEGCFDRFMEAKDAVAKFSKVLLAAHPENNVALIPFSIRDESIVPYLNAYNVTSKNLKNWLIEGSKKDQYFPAESGVTESGGALLGRYSTIVDLSRNLDKIENTLDRLFTTPNTDYVYGLSQAYNMLYARSDKAKAEKRAVVVFLSDGKPFSPISTGSVNVSGTATIMSFVNYDTHIYTLANAIKSTEEIVPLAPKTTEEEGRDPDFWTKIGGYLRHDVDKSTLVWDDDNTTVLGAEGMGAQLVTVGYMLDAQGSYDRLENMASSSESFIKITDTQGADSGYLAEQLLENSIFPGGRNSVLRDVISKYYYVPDDADLPDGVTIDGTVETGQTVVWEIGDIYAYSKMDEPSITIPLVLREQYRDVSRVTYYPTNDDVPEPSLYDPQPGPDGPDTGAKLYYTDPSDTERYDTIGTPKLPVTPQSPEEEPPEDDDDEDEPEAPVLPPEVPEVPPSPPDEPILPPGEPEIPEVPSENDPPTRDHPPANADVTQEYTVYDEEGVPLGKWVYQDDQWVFIDEGISPLDSLPKTGNTAMHCAMLLGWALIGTGIILKASKPYRGKRIAPRR